MNNYKEYELPLYRNPAKDNASPAHLDSSILRGIDVASKATRNNIMRVANAACDLGIWNILSSMASLIAPLSSVYTKHVDAESRAYIISNARYSFMWMKEKKDLEYMSAPANAKFVVAFTIISTKPKFHALALAYMLLKFMEIPVRDGDCQRFQMVDLCYKFDLGNTIHGAMYFNHLMDDALYLTTSRATNTADDCHILTEKNNLFSTWNQPCQYFTPRGVERHALQHRALTKGNLIKDETAA